MEIILFHFNIQEPLLRIAIDFRSLLNTDASDDSTYEENSSSISFVVG